jgi:hypothetical protein
MFGSINSVLCCNELLHSHVLLALSWFQSNYKYDRCFVDERRGAIWLTPCLILELNDGLFGKGRAAVTFVVNTAEVS